MTQGTPQEQGYAHLYRRIMSKVWTQEKADAAGAELTIGYVVRDILVSNGLRVAELEELAAFLPLTHMSAEYVTPASLLDELAGLQDAVWWLDLEAGAHFIFQDTAGIRPAKTFGMLLERDLPDGRIGAVMPQTFDQALMGYSRPNAGAWDDCWEYPTVRAALNALAALVPGTEPYGWTRHPSDGRRRPAADPSLEYRRQ